MDTLLQKLFILRTPGVGPAKYKKLLSEYGDVYSVVDSLGLSETFKDSVRVELDLANRLSVKYITEDDEIYPRALLKQKNHPVIISVRGNTDTLSKPAVAMVGTRHSTAIGMNFMSNLANEFANAGNVIVSGMAIGTDTSAHIGALRCPGNTQTIAVLAGGVDYIWPQENESLYYEIMERGLIISDMPVGMKPNPQNFIQRNRLIAGISDKLFLGEADIKSGSMATAKFALEYGVPVYAIPGHPSDSRSCGPNFLIKQGLAHLYMPNDNFYDKQKTKNTEFKSFLLDKIGMIPVSESVLTELVKRNITETKSELVLLELQGLIRKQDGGYVLNK